MTNGKPKKFVGVERWRLDNEMSQSGCLPPPPPPPPRSYFSRLLAFRPFMFGVCARFHCRSSWCRVCEVRLFGSRLSARASVSPPPVSSQIPNRPSKRSLKQKHNFYVLSSKKRRDAKTDKGRRKPCLAVVPRHGDAGDVWQHLSRHTGNGTGFVYHARVELMAETPKIELVPTCLHDTAFN